MRKAGVAGVGLTSALMEQIDAFAKRECFVSHRHHHGVNDETQNWTLQSGILIPFLNGNLRCQNSEVADELLISAGTCLL